MRTLRVTVVARVGEAPADLQVWTVQIPFTDEVAAAAAFGFGEYLVNRAASALRLMHVPLTHTTWEVVDYGPLNPKESHR